MRVCAIILNYFGAADTAACVQQLCGQSIHAMCIVDNSADPDEAERLAAACAGHAHVRMLATGSNAGFAAGVNYGLRSLNLSDIDAVLILNNDTVIPEGFVETLTCGARAAGLQIAGPRIHQYPDTGRLWSRGWWYNAWSGLITRRRLPGSLFFLSGCCLLIQSRVFKTIGLFDERFFMYGEDVEFCSRAGRASLSIGVIEDALLFHKTSASAGHNSLFYEQQVARAHLLLPHCLFTRRSLRALSTCPRLFSLSARALLRTLRFGNLNALKGLASARGRRDAHIHRTTL
jgi:N-acetylglucosaminyl-diphospho-decaprenol L-rhamnosyltransferase